MSLPSWVEALGILREAGCSEGVVDHCVSVTKIALRIAGDFRERGVDVDMELVEAGALLHDLGRSKTHGIRHGVVGGRIARRMGLPERLVKVIERHIGAGIPEEEAKKLGLPSRSYVPETVEEKIVSYADKLIEGCREVEFGATVGKMAEELGEDHPALDRLWALHDEIVGVLKRGS